MIGPYDTPYEGGLFRIRIEFPTDYPYHGPEFIFENKIYHTNVNFNYFHYNPGHISISTLNEWRTTGKVMGKNNYGIKHALLDIFCLFYKQGVQSPFNEEAADLFINNPSEFNKKAAEWTKQYASFPNTNS